MKYNSRTVDYRDDYGNDLRGGMDEGMEEIGRFYGHARKPRNMRPHAGQVFIGRNGKVWERYETKSGKLSVRPYKAK